MEPVPHQVVEDASAPPAAPSARRTHHQMAIAPALVLLGALAISPMGPVASRAAGEVLAALALGGIWAPLLVDAAPTGAGHAGPGGGGDAGLAKRLESAASEFGSVAGARRFTRSAGGGSEDPTGDVLEARDDDVLDGVSLFELPDLLLLLNPGRPLPALGFDALALLARGLVDPLPSLPMALVDDVAGEVGAATQALAPAAGSPGSLLPAQIPVPVSPVPAPPAPGLDTLAAATQTVRLDLLAGLHPGDFGADDAESAATGETLAVASGLGVEGLDPLAGGLDGVGDDLGEGLDVLGDELAALDALDEIVDGVDEGLSEVVDDLGDSLGDTLDDTLGDVL